MARAKIPTKFAQEAAAATEVNIIPNELLPLATGVPAKLYRPQGGRPKSNELVVLSARVQRDKAAFLANAYDMIITTVANSVPMLCIEHCPHINSCLLETEDRPWNYPMGLPETGFRCPTEYRLFYTMFYAYMAQLDIDEASPTEVQTAASLAGIQVKKARIENLISQQGMIVEQGVGTDKATGQAIVRYDEHPLLVTLDRLEKREDAIKKQFYITREQQEAKKKENQRGLLKTPAQWLSAMTEEGDIIDVEAVGEE
jgi:hypothetical protein